MAFVTNPNAGFDPKAELLEALNSVTTMAKYASFAHLADNFDPDIYVQDVGPIHLPLSDRQARQLMAKSHQSPFGRGSETIVDTAVRNTCEIDPDQFEIRHTRWGEYMDKIIAIVARDLGVTEPITAKLYKMLLYEKGAMFKAHTE